MSTNFDSVRPPPPDESLQYRRIILKLSGEALCGEMGGFGIRPETLTDIATELAEVHRLGVQIGIVVGGGNIFRGLKGASAGMDRSQSDYMGMLATVINAAGGVVHPAIAEQAQAVATGAAELHPTSS